MFPFVHIHYPLKVVCLQVKSLVREAKLNKIVLVVFAGSFQFTKKQD